MKWYLLKTSIVVYDYNLNSRLYKLKENNQNKEIKARKITS